MQVLAAPQRFEHDRRSPVARAVEGLYVGRHVFLDYAKDGFAPGLGGAVGAATAVGALGLGVARLRSECLTDKVDGVGLLAMSAHSALEACQLFGGPGASDAVLGPLKMVQGVATVAVGAAEIKKKNYLVGALAIAQGAALTGSGCLPNLAPALHLVAAAAFAGKEVARHYGQ